MSAAAAPTGVRGRRPAFLVLCAVVVLGATGVGAEVPAVRAAAAGHTVVAGSPGEHRSSHLAAGPGRGSDAPKPAKKRVSLASVGWAVLAVAVLAAAVATPLLLRRHRDGRDTRRRPSAQG